MTRVYKPYKVPWGCSASIDPIRCKAEVNSGYSNYRQCSRKAGKDGWCKQHHPDAQAKRDREAAELRDYHYKNSAAYKLKKALERIEELEEQLEVLRANYLWEDL